MSGYVYITEAGRPGRSTNLSRIKQEKLTFLIKVEDYINIFKSIKDVLKAKGSVDDYMKSMTAKYTDELPAFKSSSMIEVKEDPEELLILALAPIICISCKYEEVKSQCEKIKAKLITFPKDNLLASDMLEDLDKFEKYVMGENHIKALQSCLMLSHKYCLYLLEVADS